MRRWPLKKCCSGVHEAECCGPEGHLLWAGGCFLAEPSHGLHSVSISLARKCGGRGVKIKRDGRRAVGRFANVCWR